MVNIWVAAADNQREVVEKYISSGEFAADAKDPNGYTPIHAAASYGHLELLQYLIDKQGDVNVQDAEGDTPLHHVEDVATAKYLVEKLGADYKIKNNDGMTAVEYIEDDDEFPEVVEYLRTLAHGGVDDSRVEDANDFVASLPAPGTVDGHQIRYTLESDPSKQEQEELSEEELAERRKKIEAILNSDNPEEGLRDIVRNAVQEGMMNFQAESADEPDSKKRR
ncbi:ankyrin-repeat protein [Suhomyces tanzawaensis NRRL Y-17324]|uniref:Ankyrin-repeat protein n=1 Tax=Suhomyces tanzawaensis NRRL Y-17324 TaxID=984487 RepID=A0A1E4SL27_9ASCO|nr:ankyrin-repeat protein [Suhomyces tanzawaensis NRRL Y-17324]ODV80190.1 ankyrin-repeat protein [Suhomyces tanzawaensis NRRL Y-17324]